MINKLLKKAVGAYEGSYEIEIKNNEDNVIVLEDRAEELIRKSTLKSIREIIEKYNEYKITDNLSDEEILDLAKVFSLQLSYHDSQNSKEEKSKILKEIEELYYKNVNEITLSILARLQANFGEKENIIFNEEVVLNPSASIYRIRGDIYRNVIKRNNNNMEYETKKMYEELSIYNYEKGLELEEDNFKLRHSLAQILIMKADENNKEIVDIAIYHLNKLLESFEENNNNTRKEKFITYQLLTLAYRKKCEFTKFDGYEVWEENAKCLSNYMEIMDSYEISKRVKKKYYREKEKICMEIAVGYFKYAKFEMAKLYLNIIIETYHNNKKLYNRKKYDLLMRAFATKAKVLDCENNYKESRDNLEMALNLESIDKSCKRYAKKVVNKCKEYIRYTPVIEEGIIKFIDEVNKEMVIYCKTCGDYHYADISYLLDEYTIDEIIKKKEDKVIVEFTALKSFISPLSKESCKKDACYIRFTDKKCTEIIEDADTCAKAIESLVTKEEKLQKETDIKTYELNLVESDCIGTLSYNPYLFKGYAYTINMDIDYSFDAEDVESNLNIDELGLKLSAYESSKSYIKFDIYESIEVNTKRVMYFAKNIKFLIS